MLMSKSHLFFYFLLCHFLKFSLKLLNLVISRAIFSGCELAAGQARNENNHLKFQSRCQTASNSSTFSMCAICMPLPFVWESDHQRAANFQKNERIEPMIFRWMLSKHRSSMCRNFWSVKISEDFFYCDRARRIHWLQLRISKNVSRRSRIGHLYCCWSSRIPYSIVVFGYFV